MKFKKWTRLLLDIDTHTKIEKIQLAESEKFYLPMKRTKQDVMEDCLKLGMKEFVKIHELDIKL